MKAAIKTEGKTTYHKDGTVSYFNIFIQQWERKAASRISDEVLSSMNQQERDQIAKMAAEEV